MRIATSVRLAGDSVGRGQVSTSGQPTCFPIRVRDQKLAGYAMDVRRGRTFYSCTPPTATSVCVIHLDCTFPYDIWANSHVFDHEGGSRWRNVLLSVPWRLSTSGVRVGTLSRRLFPAPSYTGEKIPPVVSLSWQVVSPLWRPPRTRRGSRSQRMVHLRTPCGRGTFRCRTRSRSRVWTVSLKTYVALGNGVFYVPSNLPPREPEFVPEQDMMSFAGRVIRPGVLCHVRCQRC